MLVNEKLKMKIPTAAIILGVEKAFDKVWHGGLIYKLIYKLSRLRLLPGHIQIMYSYVSDHTFRVSLNKILSTIFLIIAGINHDSSLGHPSL